MYRLHGSNYEGAGIGLATCQWIVRNHLGAIGIGSTIDEGSRFYLPYSPTKGNLISLSLRKVAAFTAAIYLPKG